MELKRKSNRKMVLFIMVLWLWRETTVYVRSFEARTRKSQVKFQIRSVKHQIVPAYSFVVFARDADIKAIGGAS
jgi:hypothetical protein